MESHYFMGIYKAEERFCDSADSLDFDINKLERNPVLLVDHYFVISEKLANQIKETDLIALWEIKITPDNWAYISCFY